MTVIAAGKPKESLLYQRITSVDPHERMPPMKAGKKLSDAQIELVKRWIEQGAPWQEHWAFIAPKRPEVPLVRNAVWGQNAIDNFILARLEKEGMKPSPEADPRTLIRRVTLDLTGLPPTMKEVDDFVTAWDAANAKREQVWGDTVDRLLASPRYGERMVLEWLDAARYADTNGYQTDGTRAMWPWRDWVIDAFNKNMPFDQFTIEQIAGDLLPNATIAAKDRDRLSSQSHAQRRRRPHRRGVARRLRRRSRRYDRHRLARPDGRLRALPRSQVRSDFAEGVLSALRLLQQHRRGRRRRSPQRHRSAGARIADRRAEGKNRQARKELQRTSVVV